MKEKLLKDFPPISTKDWKNKIVADLKGADYNKKLVWKTNEGLAVEPFYRSEDLESLTHLDYLPDEFPFIRGNKLSDNKWLIQQDITVKDIKKANNEAIDAINKGANSIAFIFDGKKEPTQQELDDLLKNILNQDEIQINIKARKDSKNTLTTLVQVLKNNKQDLTTFKGSIDFDPLGSLLSKGTICVLEQAIPDLIKNVIEAGKELKSCSFQAININGKHLTNAGASITQELAFSLAIGNEYMAMLTDKNIPVEEITPKIRYTFGISGNYFMEIAKIRAARLLWAKIAEAYKPKENSYCNVYIHSETATWNKTIYDPYTNMLRTQTEAMSAAIGGSNSITVQPFDEIYKEPNEFSKRIARNQQILLKKETHLDKVADPSAGSYYIETLTNSIAQEAWKLFQQVEEQGGYIQALKKEFIQKQIEEVTQKRNQNIATRREVLLGSNQYPNFNEQIEKDIDFNRLKGSTPEGEVFVKPLKQYRAAEPFEALRLATEKSGKRPKVFMFTIGNLAMRRARSQFASNFFAIAGYEIIDNNGFPTVEDGVKEAKKQNSDVIVICSSDDEYAEVAPQIYKELKDSLVVVAGMPKCTDELKAKGIKHFVHVKTNVLETLQDFNKQLGIG